jgi:hypothetical protein
MADVVWEFKANELCYQEVDPLQSISLIYKKLATKLTFKT